MLIDSFGSMFDNEVISTIVSWISFQARYTPFTNGIFNISSVVFFPERRRGVQFPDRPQAREQKMELKGGRIQ